MRQPVPTIKEMSEPERITRELTNAEETFGAECDERKVRLALMEMDERPVELDEHGETVYGCFQKRFLREVV